MGFGGGTGLKKGFLLAGGSSNMPFSTMLPIKREASFSLILRALVPNTFFFSGREEEALGSARSFSMRCARARTRRAKSFRNVADYELWPALFVRLRPALNQNGEMVR